MIPAITDPCDGDAVSGTDDLIVNRHKPYTGELRDELWFGEVVIEGAIKPVAGFDLTGAPDTA